MAGNNWQDRIVRYDEAVPVSDIVTNPDNWRIHPVFQHQLMDAVLDKIGWIRPILINENTGVMVDGHLRVARASQEEGATVPAYYLDLTEVEQATILYAFDLSQGLSVRQPSKLRSLADKIKTDDQSIQYLLASFRRSESVLDDLDDDVFKGKHDDGKLGLVRFRIGPYPFDVKPVVFERWLSDLQNEVGPDEHVIAQTILGRLDFGTA